MQTLDSIAAAILSVVPAYHVFATTFFVGATLALLTWAIVREIDRAMETRSLVIIYAVTALWLAIACGATAVAFATSIEYQSSVVGAIFAFLVAEIAAAVSSLLSRLARMVYVAS